MVTETWTIVRPGASTSTDRYGNPIPGPAVETPLPGCLVAQASTTEPVEVGRAAVITTTTIYAPNGSPEVRPGDTLRSPAGDDHTVEGDPAVWPGAGVVIPIKRTEG